MLVYCEKDGLTFGEKVYRKGYVFKLSEVLAKEVLEMSDAQLATKQKRMYGEVIFRRPTTEEVILALQQKTITPFDLEKKEKLLVATKIKSEHQRKVQSAESMMELVNDEEKSAELVDASLSDEIKVEPV